MTGVPVTARGWGWRYATRRAWAARDLDLDVAAGERILLTGLSGSGKSTLLHALAGVLGGDDEGEHEGSLRVDGSAPHAARGRTGLVLQDPDTQAVMARVGDDVAFGCENLGVPRDEIWSRVREALDLVGLDVELDHPTSALSGGQKQRLALAGALAMRPGLLLLDEPTANLDPHGVIEVRDAVARIAEATGATLIVVEHRADVWRQVVSREVRLGSGIPPNTTQSQAAPGEATRRDAVGSVPGSTALCSGEPLLDGGEIEAGPELSAGVGAGSPGVPVDTTQSQAAPGGATRRDAVGSVPGSTALCSGEPLLEARDLLVGRVKGRPVAGPIDLTVHAGEVVGITGANGAGKSTLGRTLAGLLPAVSGRVVAADALRDGAKADPFRWSSRQLLTRIGTVLQSPDHQLLASTVRAELEVGPRALKLPADEIDRRATDLLVRLRLDHLDRANPHTLSGGEKRRLTVAAMLATRPRVCVLDEPTFGQDPQTWREMVDIIRDLRRDGIAVVAITHDRELLDALGAREVVLEKAAA
ncbi:ABC transporter ATP-binding protein [Microbacterium sp. G2-8]|uniref:ABC transporter ATP-binding protein n=1 Tax=Microbacterium sp. G2-8 TaxID=2842454 RepID=UPI0027E35FEA|nr:ABC transporter ATP-binding protein [Microbacterium sp. G2-8]